MNPSSEEKPAGEQPTGDKVAASADPACEKPAAACPADEKSAAATPPDDKPAATNTPDDKPAAASTADEKSATATPPDEKPAATNTADEKSATASSAGENAATKTMNAVKPTRRAAVAARRPAADNAAATKAAPLAPDKAKTVALAICGLLAVGILGMGGYLLLRPKPPVTVKVPLENLSGEARALAEKALKAETIYKEGKEKAASANLAELREADEKLTKANDLFNEIVDQNQTVAGFKDQIDLARNKKLSIDKELLAIREKIRVQENEERLNKLKAASGTKPAEGTPSTTPAAPAPVPATGKEPTDAELTDANLDRLFKDDPSEYERLAKIRKAKDPNYVIKKE